VISVKEVWERKSPNALTLFDTSLGRTPFSNARYSIVKANVEYLGPEAQIYFASHKRWRWLKMAIGNS
jgi:hypothetical protein